MNSPPGQRPLSILFLHQSAELYGSDRVLANMASYLAGRGHRVTVVLPGDGPLVKVLSGGASVAILDVPVIRRSRFKGLGAVRFLAGLPAAHAAIGRLARHIGADLLITNTGTMVSAGLWARLHRLPHLWIIHEIYRGRGCGARLFALAVDKLADSVICPSAAVAESLSETRSKLSAKIHVVPNGIRAADFAGASGTVRRALNLGSDVRLAGIVGRFNWWKGQREMVPVMARATAINPQAHFVFVGGAFAGEEGIMDDFRSKVKSAGLDNRVHVLGELAETSGVYADLDLLVLPSIQAEPFGLVLLEAMAAGKPVVAYDQGGPREIIDPSCGLLIQPGDGEAMAEAIVKLLSNPGLRRALGEAGRAKAQRDFTVERQGQAVEKLAVSFVAAPKKERVP